MVAEEIGKKIKRARNERGWTRERLARTLNQASGHDSLTGGYIGRWERGVRNPGHEWAPVIAEVLGLDLAELDDTTRDQPTRVDPDRLLRRRTPAQG